MLLHDGLHDAHLAQQPIVFVCWQLRHFAGKWQSTLRPLLEQLQHLGSRQVDSSKLQPHISFMAGPAVQRLGTHSCSIMVHHAKPCQRFNATARLPGKAWRQTSLVPAATRHAPKVGSKGLKVSTAAHLLSRTCGQPARSAAPVRAFEAPGHACLQPTQDRALPHTCN